LTITDKSKPFIIAEIGHNHGGSFEHCKRLIALASESDADAVKLQKRNNKELYTKELYNSPYDNRNSYGATYGLHREALEFGVREYRALKTYAENLGLYFFATPFDFNSVDFLCELKVPLFKIQSGDLQNIPLVEYIAKQEKPIILSTGGAKIEDITRAVISLQVHESTFALLHCVSLYPTKARDLQVYMIPVLKRLFEDIVVGFSSHYDGILGPLMAYLMGAMIIEVHFTDSRSNKGSDHSFSLTPQGLKELIHYIDEARQIFEGNNKPKTDRTDERRAIKKLMKSLYFRRSMKKGDTVRMEDLAIKSPYDERGVGVYMLDKIVNTMLRIDVKEGQLINKEIYLNMIIQGGAK
jgi:N-acetylneuraminate synthase/sialic acid synthase